MIGKIATGVFAALLLTGCGRVDPKTSVADAKELIAEGKAGEARVLLKNALAKANNNVPGARQMLARIALDDGDIKAANDELEALDATAAAEPAAVALKVRVALERNQLDTAAKLLDAVGDALLEPDRTLLRARLLREQGKAAESLAGLRALQESRPDDEAVLVEVVASLEAMGNLDAAVDEVNRFLANDKRPKGEALRMRGEVQLRQGKAVEGVKDLRAALKAVPPQWPAIRRMSTELAIGEGLLAAGDTAGAREHITYLQNTMPGMLGTDILAARVDVLDGNFGVAAERLGKVADSLPGNARLQYMLADALVRSGNLARATEVLEKRVAEEPATSPARRLLANVLMRQGKPARVVELLDEGAGAPGAKHDELLEAARLTMSRASEAISTLTARVAAEPDNALLRAQLAMAQIANGDSAQALTTLGPMPTSGWQPETAAARMTALLTMGNDLEANKLVDRLTDASTRADVATLMAASDMAQRQNRPAIASRLLDRAAKVDAGSTEVQLRRASLAFDAKRYDDTEKLLRDLLKVKPADMLAGVALGRVLEAKGKLDAARKALKDAASHSPQAPEPMLTLANLELRAGRLDEAGKAFDAMIATKPDGTMANVAGVLLVEGAHFEEARTRFRQAIEQNGKVAEYWFSLGRTQIALNDLDAARESFLKSVDLQPAALPAAAAAVRLSIEKKDHAAAQRVARQVVTALPDNAGAWLLQGEAALAAGQGELATSSFARAARIRPSAPAAVGEFQARRAMKAVRPEAPLLAWLARESGDVTIRHLLIDYYMSSDRDTARQQMETLLQKFPNDIAALNNLAWLLRTSDPARAERLATQAHAIAPDNPLVGDTLGTIYLARGKIDAAVTALAASATKAPDNRTLQYHYALALSRAGKVPEARAVLRKALDGGAAFEERAEALTLQEKLGK